MKKISKSFYIILLCLVLAGCTFPESNDAFIPEPGVAPSPTPSEQALLSQIPAEAEKIGDKLPVSRGLAAKMLALAFSDQNTIRGMDREISYQDTNTALWYDKYINAATIQGYIPQTGDTFHADEPLTLAQAQDFLSAVHPQTAIKMQLTNENRDLAISYALWCQLYLQLLDEMTGGQDLEAAYSLKEESLVVLATSGNNSKLPQYAVITDMGPYSGEGLVFDEYIDKQISVLTKDGEIAAILRLDSHTPTISGAYVVSQDSSTITLFAGGAERTYAYSGSAQGGVICNVTLSGGGAVQIVPVETPVVDTVKRIRKDMVEFESAGTLPVHDEFKVYAATGGPVKWRSLRNIIVGTDMARFYVDNGVCVAAVIYNTVTPEQLRVAIKTNGFESFVHESVTVTATAGFTVTADGESRTYAPGEEVLFNTPQDLNTRAYITCDGGTITLQSLERAYGTPTYRGVVEIAPVENGFLLVNQVDLEEYLYSVVPSEMPTSYGLEALKVQAVTARSYAYNQFYANTFHEYGANVCDSVISQVYNNVAENDLSRQCVDDTRGQCLTYGGEVISANFFSTSAGVTANNGEVWANAVTKEFPTENSPYLTSKPQFQGADYGDLSIEENAAKFIKSKDIQSYDSGSAWFRWYVEMTNEELSAAVNANLAARYEANPRLIKTLQPDGIYRSRPVTTIGSLVNIEAVKRGQGGNIMTLRITGTENTVLIHTEYNIRTLLQPKQHLDGGEPITLQLNDGAQMADYSILPSGFFAMERMTDVDGRIVYVKFYGGGNGHGVGMSQTGVLGMVNAGFSFDDILSHYYSGTVVEKKW